MIAILKNGAGKARKPFQFVYESAEDMFKISIQKFL